ncbi:MAG: endolytic transglycosylase MltG [Oscillospiraceae bacterium]|jgi:UPF0755 protein|nr:endolytic transglycosylase MltG [Oscillospiraceae bacterium]
MEHKDNWKNPFGEDGEHGGDKPPDEPSGGAESFYTYDLTRGGGVPGGAGAEPAPEFDFNPGKDADDFKISFDFDREYRDLPENRPLRQRREKRTGCLGGMLFAAFIICVSLVLAALAWLVVTDVLGFGGSDEVVQITIPKNFDADTVAEILSENGLIKYKFLFKLYNNISKDNKKIVPGTYELQMSYDYHALVIGMSARGTRVEVTVTIPEGFTMAQIFDRFESKGVCSAEELWAAAADHDFDYDFLDDKTLGERYRLEGYLFPDTYKLFINDTPTHAISKLLDNFKAKFNQDCKDAAEALGYSMRDIVIVASMIESEAGDDSDRPLIASVIYNRLNSGEFPHLQIDATIYYAIAETGEAFSTELDSPYNTYQCVGLPAGPISNPGIMSIKAALEPQSTGYYYYALSRAGHHEFFTDYDAFLAFLASDDFDNGQ